MQKTFLLATRVADTFGKSRCAIKSEDCRSLWMISLDRFRTMFTANTNGKIYL